MTLNFLDVLSSLIGLFLLIGVGYAAAKTKIMPQQVSPYLSAIVMKISLPCTVFTALMRPYDPSLIGDIVTAMLLGLVIVIPTAVLAMLFVRLMRVRRECRGMWTFCVTFSNNIFMGYPMAYALYGDDGLMLAAIFGILYTVLIYLVGGWFIMHDTVRGDDAVLKVNLRKLLLTGINAAAVVGLFVYFTQLTVPKVILTPISYISNLTTPLSMFVTGINLTRGTWSENFGDRDALKAAFTRLIPMPVCSLLILKMINAAVHFQNPLMLGTAQIILSMPTAAVAPILAENYGVDRSFAAREVFLSSLMCIITIPLIAMLL